MAVERSTSEPSAGPGAVSPPASARDASAQTPAAGDSFEDALTAAYADEAAHAASDDDEAPEGFEDEIDGDDDADPEDFDDEDEDGDEPDEPEDDEAADEAESGTESRQHEPASPEAWAQELLRDPDLVARIPQKMRGPAVRLFATTLYQDAVESTRTRVLAAAKLYYEKEAVRQDDPDAFLEWEDEHPDEVTAYRWAKAQITGKGGAAAPPAGEPDGAASQSFNVKAVEQFNRLNSIADPAMRSAATQRIQQKAAAQQYPDSPEGLAAITADVADELVKALQGGGGRANATRRADAANERRDRPRRPTAGVARSTASNPIANETDVTSLLSDGFTEEARRGTRGPRAVRA